MADTGTIDDTGVEMLKRILTLVNHLPSYWQVFGVKGILNFALIRYGSPHRVRKLFLKGIIEPIYLRCDTTDPGTMREVFFDRDYDVETDHKIDCIVDAGANIGMTAVYFANKYPDATTLAIEPEVNNFTLLKKNTAKYPRIIPIQAALWNHTGLIQLHDPGRGEHGYVTREEQANSDASTHAVPSVTMSDLMSRFSISMIDLFKVDIEGAEKEVFETSEAWIDKVALIIVELHDRFKPGCTSAVSSGTHGMQTVLKRGKLIVLKRPLASLGI